MSEAPARTWLAQVESDLLAAERVLDRAQGGAWSYCQAIAKQQQAVEKSIRTIVAALRESGLMNMPTRRIHRVDHEISALIRLSSAHEAAPRDVGDHIRHLLNEHRRGEIRALCALAPRWPGPGDLFTQNHEYPFQSSDGSWRAPAEAGSFRLSEDVDRFRVLMNEVVRGTRRLVTALDRMRSR